MPGAGGRYAIQQVSGSSFVPTDIAGCLCWYDASNAGSITATGGAVSQWNDLADVRHISQSSTGAKPTTGARTQNGRNVLDFDGNDFLSTSVGVTFNQPTTAFVVGALDAESGSFNVMFDGFSGTQAMYANVSDHTWKMYAGGGVDVGGGTVDTGCHVHTAKFNGGSSARYVDGASVGTGDPGGAGRVNVLVGAQAGGASSFWDGSICEVILYDTALGNTDRATVEAYLKAKWGTP